jgi:hypothetical protein
MSTAASLAHRGATAADVRSRGGFVPARVLNEQIGVAEACQPVRGVGDSASEARGHRAERSVGMAIEMAEDPITELAVAYAGAGGWITALISWVAWTTFTRAWASSAIAAWD